MSTHIFLFCINEAFFRGYFFYLVFFNLALEEGFLRSYLFLFLKDPNQQFSVDLSPAEHIHM